jgi:hypothetical protein
LLPGVWIKLEAKLSGDDNLVPDGRQGFPDQLFVGEGAIDFGSVKERDASINRRADKRDSRLLVDGWAEAKA